MREHLRAAASEPEHPRDWRPQILAFSKDSRRRYELLRFALWIEGGSGLTTAVRILEGEGVKMLKLRAEAEAEIHADILEHNLSVFPLVVFAPNLQIGIQTLIQAFGIGPLRANTIILNWFEQLPRGILGLSEPSYVRNLWAAFRLGFNIIVLDAEKSEWDVLEAMPPEERRIDVWWCDDATSTLTLLLAYLMKRNEEWGEAGIRVLAACHQWKSEKSHEELRRTLEEVRIETDSAAVEAAKQVEKKLKEMRESISADSEKEVLEKIKEEVKRAEEEAKKAARKAAKAQAKADEAVRSVESLEWLPDEEKRKTKNSGASQ